jgi:hypothetical protein
MLPIAAPVTAPAVCFGIGGTWMSSDDGGLFFFSGFGWLGINGGLLIFDSLQRYFGWQSRHSRSKVKMPCDTHSQPTTDFEFEKHCQPFLGTDSETLSVAMRISNEDSSLVAIAPASPIPRTGRAIWAR